MVCVKQWILVNYTQVYRNMLVLLTSDLYNHYITYIYYRFRSSIMAGRVLKRVS